MNYIKGFIFIAVILFIYFLPTIVARKKSFAMQVFILNFFLGFTLIGWVGALIWAAKDEKTIKV